MYGHLTSHPNISLTLSQTIERVLDIGSESVNLIDMIRINAKKSFSRVMLGWLNIGCQKIGGEPTLSVPYVNSLIIRHYTSPEGTSMFVINQNGPSWVRAQSSQ